ncbi:ABC transporter ATP-binding protein [Amycolatopsis ultiminotia]|uniref:ABC transporter ATP-binding protein n=1 Tax=Amycolatopsis ultiminotia TaxID=543629 RepID=A0ABP6YLX6_9PSEU
MNASPTGDPVLSVRDLCVEFRTPQGWAPAVSGLDFDLYANRTLAVLGESGSGKSATARAIMGVLPANGARVPRGRVAVHGADLLAMRPARRRAIRGPVVGMVFQDAQAALNPVLPVGYQIAEGCRVHRGLSRRAARARAVDLLGQVGIPRPARAASRFPHQFSGGMRQRVMIAATLALDPEVLIADEPTTALDVTVQAQILRLLLDLQQERGMSLMFITHDMGVVATVADEVLVMYAGRSAEYGPADTVLGAPGHPYTKALLASIPRPEHRGQDLPAIGGQPPELTQLGTGCAFRPRCPKATDICRVAPPAVPLQAGRHVWCHHTGDRPAEPALVS